MDSTFGNVDSVEFAIYLNKKANDLGKHTNMTKIHKWLYICYGTYLVAYNKQPLLNEQPQAWDHGPFFPRVYDKQKANGDSLDGLDVDIDVEKFKQYDEIIDPILGHFGTWSATGLVNWTHEEGKAWDKAFSKGKKSLIDHSDIYSDFRRFVSNG